MLVQDRRIRRSLSRDSENYRGEGDSAPGILDPAKDCGHGDKSVEEEADRVQVGASGDDQGGRDGCDSLLQEQVCATGLRKCGVSGGHVDTEGEGFRRDSVGDQEQPLN